MINTVMLVSIPIWAAWVVVKVLAGFQMPLATSSEISLVVPLLVLAVAVVDLKSIVAPTFATAWRSRLKKLLMVTRRRSESQAGLTASIAVVRALSRVQKLKLAELVMALAKSGFLKASFLCSRLAHDAMDQANTFLSHVKNVMVLVKQNLKKHLKSKSLRVLMMA